MLLLEGKLIIFPHVWSLKGVSVVFNYNHNRFNQHTFSCPAASMKSLEFAGNGRAGEQSLGGECCGCRGSQQLFVMGGHSEALWVVGQWEIEKF